MTRRRPPRTGRGRSRCGCPAGPTARAAAPPTACGRRPPARSRCTGGSPRATSSSCTCRWRPGCRARTRGSTRSAAASWSSAVRRCWPWSPSTSAAPTSPTVRLDLGAGRARGRRARAGHASSPRRRPTTPGRTAPVRRRRTQPRAEAPLIAYHDWANRGPSTMRVWLPLACDGVTRRGDRPHSQQPGSGPRTRVRCRVCRWPSPAGPSSRCAYGGPEVLRLVDVDPGDPGPGNVLVEVRAAGVNPTDWKGYAGVYGTQPREPAHAARVRGVRRRERGRSVGALALPRRRDHRVAGDAVATRTGSSSPSRSPCDGRRTSTGRRPPGCCSPAPRPSTRSARPAPATATSCSCTAARAASAAWSSSWRSCAAPR